MIGLILLYFIGKTYFNLAQPYVKNAWIFAIVGIAAYYLGIVIGGFIIGIAFAFGWFPYSIDSVPNFTLGLIAIPFGVLTCWGLYAILKRNWTKPRETD